MRKMRRAKATANAEIKRSCPEVARLLVPLYMSLVRGKLSIGTSGLLALSVLNQTAN